MLLCYTFHLEDAAREVENVVKKVLSKVIAPATSSIRERGKLARKTWVTPCWRRRRGADDMRMKLKSRRWLLFAALGVIVLVCFLDGLR
jgi:hypothetical protein